eukprot:943519-Pleurochrysis_carterae.AAC.1
MLERLQVGALSLVLLSIVGARALQQLGPVSSAEAEAAAAAAAAAAGSVSAETAHWLVAATLLALYAVYLGYECVRTVGEWRSLRQRQRTSCMLSFGAILGSAGTAGAKVCGLAPWNGVESLAAVLFFNM